MKLNLQHISNGLDLLGWRLATVLGGRPAHGRVAGDDHHIVGVAVVAGTMLLAKDVWAALHRFEIEL